MKTLITSICLVILLIFSGTSLAGDLETYQKRGHKAPTWTPLVEAGIAAYDSENFSAALNFFNQAINKGCRDGLVYFKLGIYNESIDDLQTAKKYLQLAKKYLPKRYLGHAAARGIHEHLGRVLFSLGETSAAKSELELSAAGKGNNFTNMFLLGSIAKQENNDEKVAYYYSKALTYTPPVGTNPQELLVTLLVEIGKARYNLKEYDKSLAVWNQLLSKVPGHPIARQYVENIKRMQTDTQIKKEEQRILRDIVQ